MKTKQEQLRLIDSIYGKLRRSELDSDYHFDRFIDAEKAAERHHRNSFSGGRQCGLTVSMATKYFVCHHILKHRAGTWKDEKGHAHKPYVPKAEDILSTRLECFHGYALWHKHKDSISKAVSKAQAVEFMRDVDYPKLMEVPE